MKYSWTGHEERNKHNNRIKRSGQARLVYVRHKPWNPHHMLNRNIPTTWRWARGARDARTDFLLQESNWWQREKRSASFYIVCSFEKEDFPQSSHPVLFCLLRSSLICCLGNMSFDSWLNTTQWKENPSWQVTAAMYMSISKDFCRFTSLAIMASKKITERIEYMYVLKQPSQVARVREDRKCREDRKTSRGHKAKTSHRSPGEERRRKRKHLKIWL